jgi:L-lactate dehydrogenase complex protein LldG
MEKKSSREEILLRIAAAPERRSAFVDSGTITETSAIYKPIEPDAINCFKNELVAVNGKCILCENEKDLYRQLKIFVETQSIPTLFCRDNYISQQLQKFNIPFADSPDQFIEMKAGITGCEFLIARTGSVMASSASESGRQMIAYPPVHIVLAHVSQLVDYPEDALAAIQEKYADQLPSTVTTITGPSRTADIEKTLVLGAHGPKEFIVFLSKV